MTVLRRSPRGAAVAAVALLAAGCTSSGGADEQNLAALEAPFAGCEELTTAPPAGGAVVAGGTPLPELTLPCFTGDEPVALADLRGPALVNLWATWCDPCREELPILQRLADQTAGQLHVVGVVTRDTRPRAASLGEDLEITFPMLFDPDEQLLAEVAPGLRPLPVTLLVDPAGDLAFVYIGPPYDEAKLSALVEEHLQVTIGDG